MRRQLPRDALERGDHNWALVLWPQRYGLRSEDRLHARLNWLGSTSLEYLGNVHNTDVDRVAAPFLG